MSTGSGSTLGQLFDGYSMRSRLAPALVASMPVTFSCVILFPSAADWNKLWLLAAATGFTVVVGHLVRDRGRRIQAGLWESWGGPPATAALRHRSTRNETLLIRRHRQIESLIEIPMPSKRQEIGNPQKADERYDIAVRYLISRTRDATVYHLVSSENCNYGFRRNMLGIRFLGMFLSVSTFLGSASGVIWSFASADVWRLDYSFIVSVSLLLFFLWLRVVRSEWVRDAAECYAERLIESLDTLMPLGAEQPPPSVGPGE